MSRIVVMCLATAVALGALGLERRATACSQSPCRVTTLVVGSIESRCIPRQFGFMNVKLGILITNSSTAPGCTELPAEITINVTQTDAFGDGFNIQLGEFGQPFEPLVLLPSQSAMGELCIEFPAFAAPGPRIFDITLSGAFTPRTITARVDISETICVTPLDPLSCAHAGDVLSKSFLVSNLTGVPRTVSFDLTSIQDSSAPGTFDHFPLAFCGDPLPPDDPLNPTPPVISDTVVVPANGSTVVCFDTKAFQECHEGANCSIRLLATDVATATEVQAASALTVVGDPWIGCSGSIHKVDSFTAEATNFHVLSNGLDSSLQQAPPGGDRWGVGHWIRGEELRGATVSAATGDFAYKQAGFIIDMCSNDTRISFPQITLAELSGRNANLPDVFLNPNCTGAGPGGLSPPMGTTLIVPYGVPPGASVSWLAGSFPAAGSIPSFLPQILPNHGIVPSSNGGDWEPIGMMRECSLPVASTGFCWSVAFQWAPSCLPSHDDADGWWFWFNADPHVNQTFGLSIDELNPWQSHTVVYNGTNVGWFTANVELSWQSLSKDPVTNLSLQPAGWTDTGPYYATSGASGGVQLNYGFDLGRHIAVSVTGTGGVTNPNTFFGNQDPAATGGGTPAMGFATWNNRNYTGGGPAPSYRLTWVQADWDRALGVDPDLASDATVYLGEARVPVPIPASIPAPWPQAITSILFPLYVHATMDLGALLDPTGLPGGTFDIPPFWGTSNDIPPSAIFPPGPVPICTGVVLGIQYGSTGLLGPGGPLTFNPNLNAPSVGLAVALIL